MARPIRAGVMAAVKVDDVNGLTDREQDQFIKEVAVQLEGQLRDHVGGAQPIGDLSFWVTGPHRDPLQGLIHVHHLAGPFDLDKLPTECPAYQAEMRGQAPAAGPLPGLN